MKEFGEIQILNETSQQQFEHIRNLNREFVKWCLQRHLEDLDLINE
jgi:hypothetical protein